MLAWLLDLTYYLVLLPLSCPPLWTAMLVNTSQSGKTHSLSTPGAIKKKLLVLRRMSDPALKYWIWSKYLKKYDLIKKIQNIWFDENIPNTWFHQKIAKYMIWSKYSNYSKYSKYSTCGTLKLQFKVWNQYEIRIPRPRKPPLRTFRPRSVHSRVRSKSGADPATRSRTSRSQWTGNCPKRSKFIKHWNIHEFREKNAKITLAQVD